MQTKILLPTLALGLALSANAFAHPWTWPIAPGANEATDTTNSGTYSSSVTASEGQLRFDHEYPAINTRHPGTAAPAKSAMAHPPKSQTKPPVANWRAEEGD